MTLRQPASQSAADIVEVTGSLMQLTVIQSWRELKIKYLSQVLISGFLTQQQFILATH
ncbi:hypothetical protein AB4Z21_32960 [Paenibacillus sp. MCAF20]